MTSAAALLFLTCALLAVPAWLWGPSWWRARRRTRVQAQPFPRAWRQILRRRMPAYARLPAPVQQRLRKLTQVLLAEKPFIGCGGLHVSEEMRVLVAAQAALLLLGGRGDYFRNLRQVLIYPDAFVVDRITPDAAGLAHATRQVLAGESWQQGQVVLSWADVLAGAADPDDGRNVVIHEFAHQLDQEQGRANGAPWLGRGGSPARWRAVLGSEFANLQQRLAQGETGLIEAYAATDAAEFFAVTSELFFEQSAALAAAHPALHGELAGYYGVDPRHW
jgi:Mlc titration factor MtfA (ptsG expression regulator)